VTATGSTRAERTIEVGRGEREAGTSVPIRLPVAGSFAFDRPRVTATDPGGLFRERLARGPAPSVTVEPRGPHDVHVGEAGEQLAAYGDHRSRRRETGLEPGELREYVPGDPAHRIDWKATARMNEPHVREFETESDRVTALLVDHRAAMGHGPPGETKLDYARQVALGFVDGLRAEGDPLGYYTVGDGGLTDRRAPVAGGYALAERRLRELQPMDRREHPIEDTTRPGGEAERHADRPDAPGGEPSIAGPETVRAPADARRAAARLDGDAAFDATLGPYFAAQRTYVERIAGDPLFETARTHLARLSGTVWTVLFTDDSHPTEVRETVRLARRANGRVLVFLTPTVLFEPGGLADLDAAYERYSEFEAFRRELARLDRVAAFEVGPGDRLDAVLAAGRGRRRALNAR
jgi:uncharacterized protein (DUF58 family)